MLSVRRPPPPMQALHLRGRVRLDTREPADVPWLSQSFAIYRDVVSGNRRTSLQVLNMVRQRCCAQPASPRLALATCLAKLPCLSFPCMVARPAALRSSTTAPTHP